MRTRGIKRKIVGYKSWYSHFPNGGPGVMLTLECGHEVYRKDSMEPRHGFAYCRQCRLNKDADDFVHDFIDIIPAEKEEP